MELNKIYTCPIIMRKIFLIILAAGLFFGVACKSKKTALESEAVDATEDVATESVTETRKKGKKPRGGGSLEERLARQEEMYSKIGLSDPQKEKFRAIETKYANKMRAAKDANEGNRESMMSALKVIQADKLAEIKAMLSPEQFTKYEEELAKMRAERRRPR